jgi:anti-sigma factor RsiW
MDHVDQGTIQAWLDGELTAAGAAGVEAHVAGCPVCAPEVRALQRAGRTARGALAVLDVPVPAAAVPAADIVAIAAAAGLRSGRRSAGRRRAAWLSAGALKAAAMVLAFAGVVAAFVPGSPVRDWIVAALTIRQAAQPQEPKDTGPVAAPAPEHGWGVAPVAGRVEVRLVGPGAGSRVVVRLVEGTSAMVLWAAEGDAPAQVRTRTGAGWIALAGLGRGTVTVEVPRDVAAARVEVDGRVWWQKSDGHVRTPGPLLEATAEVTVFEVRPRT